MALLGNFASGSQRKSLREISKATSSPRVSAMKSVRTSTGVEALVVASFQAVRKVSGWHEESCALNPVREDSERDAGA